MCEERNDRKEQQEADVTEVEAVVKTQNVEMEKDCNYSAQKAQTSVLEGNVMKISVITTKLFNSPFQILVCLNIPM